MVEILSSPTACRLVTKMMMGFPAGPAGCLQAAPRDFLGSRVLARRNPERLNSKWARQDDDWARGAEIAASPARGSAQRPRPPLLLLIVLLVIVVTAHAVKHVYPQGATTKAKALIRQKAHRKPPPPAGVRNLREAFAPRQPEVCRIIYLNLNSATLFKSHKAIMLIATFAFVYFLPKDTHANHGSQCDIIGRMSFYFWKEVGLLLLNQVCVEQIGLLERDVTRLGLFLQVFG